MQGFFSSITAAGHFTFSQHGSREGREPVGVSSASSETGEVDLYGLSWHQDASDDIATADSVLNNVTAAGFKSGATLHGNYVLFFYDRARRVLTVETDLFAVYPCYYTRGADGSYHFASSLQEVARLVPVKPNLEAIAQILKYGYIITNDSPVSGIFRLTGNSRLIIRDGKLTCYRMERGRFARNRRFSAELMQELDASFINCISRFKSVSGNALSVSLSGGLDSRIAAFAAKRAGFDLDAFSAGVNGSLECRVAAQVAELLEMPFQAHEFSGSDFPSWFDGAVRCSETRCHPGHMHFFDRLFMAPPPSHMQLHGLIGDAVIGGSLENTGFQETSLNRAKEQCRDRMSSFVFWPHDTLPRSVSPELREATASIDEIVASYIFNAIDFNGSYSDYLWFRYFFRVLPFSVPSLMSQVLPLAFPIVPYVDNSFFALASSISTEDILDRKAQIQWSCSCFPGISAVPRIKDGVAIRFDAGVDNGYSKGWALLNIKRKYRYYLCRASMGKVNITTTETYPSYDQWYRKWPAVRRYVDGRLHAPTLACGQLWNPDGLGQLRRDLSVGRNTWNALSAVMMVDTLFRQLGEASGPEATGCCEV